MVKSLKIRQQVTIFGCELGSRPRVFLTSAHPLFRKKSYLDASSRFSVGFKKSGLEDNRAAMVSIGLKQWKIVPRISIWWYR